jgi:hypothetical protein
MKTQTLDLTPMRAALFLTNNRNNRAINKAHVEKLAAAMRAGDWALNGETIKISKSGRLLDGQHRCAAVVKSGATIQALVVFDCDDNAFKTIDKGRARLNSDSLSVLGYSHGGRLSACVNLFRAVQAGLKHASSSLKEVEETIQQHPEILEVTRLDKLRCKRVPYSAEHTFRLIAGKAYGVEYVANWIQAFADNHFDDAQAALQKALDNANYLKKSNAVLPPWWQLGLLLKAVRWSATGKKCRLMFSADETYPVLL